MTSGRPPVASEVTVQPRLVPALVIRLSVLALPRGVRRDRYRQEFLCELHDLTRAEQARHARGVLVHAFALRAAVRAAERLALEDLMTTRATKPFLCRTNLHHSWEYARTSDGARYIRCARCLKEKDDHMNTGGISGISIGSMGGGAG